MMCRLPEDVVLREILPFLSHADDVRERFKPLLAASASGVYSQERAAKERLNAFVEQLAADNVRLFE